MKTLQEYITLAAQNHGHMCPGQVLGIRMAMFGLNALGFDDPVECRKRLLTFVEIDRCATDAVSLVTGCRLGKRSLKFRDYGKVAATFVDLETERAVRIVARDDSRERANSMFPALSDPYEAQLEAYRLMGDEELFTLQRVRVALGPADLPGRPRSHVSCESCGEGINDGRERRIDGRVLCRPCAGEGYCQEIRDA
ncbi:MAG: TraR/DksA C4-type zinc finger protein [Acidobacteriia bacterium]|nr:TraR/DksA C4-type zinc finger protein [Terriglobia bacterium]